MTDEEQGWLASRFAGLSTGIKMLLILSLALFPLGLIAILASMESARENMLSRSFQPGFRIDLHHKDMGIVTSAAREAGVVVPLGGLVAQLMASARANGDDGLDHSGLLRGVERLSGRPTP